jgi:Tol biopolymer transport system component
MVAVSHPAAGGRLASGRVLFTRSSLTHNRRVSVGEAFISPDGATAIAVTSAGTASTVMRVSTATGKPSGVLYRGASNLSIRPDPSGQFILAAQSTLKHGHLTGFIGWIDHGKLALLKPANTSIEDEAW